jgi:hypothetical protein
MRSEAREQILYFRKQSAHPSHAESGDFTRSAKADYATRNNIAEDDVETGTYRSGQGRPKDDEAVEI